MIMTIDEAISHAKEVATIQRNNEKLNRTLGTASPYVNENCLKCAKEHEQLADWLEELKAYKEQHQALCNSYNVHTVEDIYDKAIDDFIKSVDKLCGYYAGECKNLTRDDLLKIAKELKDNG